MKTTLTTKSFDKFLRLFIVVEVTIDSSIVVYDLHSILHLTSCVHCYQRHGFEKVAKKTGFVYKRTPATNALSKFSRSYLLEHLYETLALCFKSIEYIESYS